MKKLADQTKRAKSHKVTNPKKRGRKTPMVTLPLSPEMHRSLSLYARAECVLNDLQDIHDNETDKDIKSVFEGSNGILDNMQDALTEFWCNVMRNYNINPDDPGDAATCGIVCKNNPLPATSSSAPIHSKAASADAEVGAHTAHAMRIVRMICDVEQELEVLDAALGRSSGDMEQTGLHRLLTQAHEKAWDFVRFNFTGDICDGVLNRNAQYQAGLRRQYSPEAGRLWREGDDQNLTEVK